MAVSSQERAASRKDKVIQSTDDDALALKVSAVHAGYLTDAFIDAFAAAANTPPLAGSRPNNRSFDQMHGGTGRRSSHQEPSPPPPAMSHSALPPQARRLPLINRGTFIRTYAIDRLVQTILDKLLPSSPEPSNPALQLSGLSRGRQINPGEDFGFFESSSAEEDQDQDQDEDDDDNNNNKDNERPKLQIISLGAGSDTRPFPLLERYGNQIVYHELDFPCSTERKARTIRGSEMLSSIVGLAPSHDDNKNNGDDIHTQRYHLHGMDLRSIHPVLKEQHRRRAKVRRARAEAGVMSSINNSRTSLDKLSYESTEGDQDTENNNNNNGQTLSDVNVIIPGLIRGIKTILISECCLCYMDPEVGNSVVEYFKEIALNGNDAREALQAYGADFGIIVYEPIGGGKDDGFGKTMIENLSNRGISMPGLMKYPTLVSQVDRFFNLLATEGPYTPLQNKLQQQETGFINKELEESVAGGAMAADMFHIQQLWLDKNEQDRINHLEFMDEVEEWSLLARHYGTMWGSSGPYFTSWWRNKPVSSQVSKIFVAHTI